jgi:hypothetical protein
MPIRSGVAAFRTSSNPPHLEPQLSQSENCWDSSVTILPESITILPEDVLPHDLPSLSASAITFKGYATMARKEDAARRTRQGNGQNGECSLHLGRRAVEKATGSLDTALDIINEETIERERLRRLVNRPPLVFLLGAPGGS